MQTMSRNKPLPNVIRTLTSSGRILETCHACRIKVLKEFLSHFLIYVD
jgi:hypothetical protein